MEAPPSRYRVVERGGRLIVIDTATGEATGAGAAAAALRPDSAPVAAGWGLMAALADAAAGLAAKGRDPQGRMVIAWEWTQNGRTKRWDAALDPAQQRRLGRALLMLVAPVPLVILSFLGGQPFFGFVWAVPLVFVGAFGLKRLQSESQRDASPNPLRNPSRSP
jgi:hypothetical protein